MVEESQKNKFLGRVSVFLVDKEKKRTHKISINRIRNFERVIPPKTLKFILGRNSKIVEEQEDCTITIKFRFKDYKEVTGTCD